MRGIVIASWPGALLLAGCSLDEAVGQEEVAAAEPVAAVGDATLLEAAGFHYEGDHWAKCGDPGTISYAPGAIAARGDFNGDGRPDAIVTEGGTYCFGMTGTGFTLVSQVPDGSWRIITEQIGIPHFLRTRGADGWPDLEVGGPGFCFPVQRWNGLDYQTIRYQYQGQPCEP